MRILVLGAGATGGYFGGRLAAAGADVTFLVRPKRAEQLAEHGLVIHSSFGEEFVEPRYQTEISSGQTFDVILLSCKAYDLNSAVTAVAPAMSPRTVIVPLLNGLQHLDALDGAFGRERVLGGSCHLSVTLGPSGDIHHLNQLHLLTFGPRSDGQEELCEAFAATCRPAKFEAKLRKDIIAAMWEKWVLLASLAGVTCLFRASIGTIGSTPVGRRTMLDLIAECHAVARESGFGLSESNLETIRELLTDPQSAVVASMLRDMEKSAPIESDQILTDLLRRARTYELATPILEIAEANLRCYEAGLARLENH